MIHRTSFALAGLVLALLLGLSTRAAAADALVIVDFSGSMAGMTSDGVTRIEAARQALNAAAPLLSEHHSGLLLFGHSRGGCDDIELVIPFGELDPTSVAANTAGRRPTGSTPLASAIRKGGDALVAVPNDSEKIMIVLTDGNETCQGNPEAEAARLRALGVDLRVHVIGFAVQKGEDVQLRAIAKAGGGDYIEAVDAKALGEALPGIVRSSLSSVKETELGREVFLSDEFSGDELDSQWEVIRPDLDRFAIVEGQAYLLTQAPVDIAEVKNLVRTREPVPGADFDASVSLDMQLTGQTQMAGLMLQDGDDHVMLAWRANKHGNNLRRSLMLYTRSAGKDAYQETRFVNGAASAAEHMELMLSRRGLDVIATARVQLVGGAEQTIDVGKIAAPSLKQIRVGLVAAGNPKAVETDARFDNARIEVIRMERTIEAPDVAGAAYSTVFASADEFDAHWEVRDRDDTHMGLSNGLCIVTQVGQVGNEDVPLKNLAVLRQGLPTGDWQIELQLAARITSQNPEFGLMLLDASGTKDLRFGVYGKQHGYNVNRLGFFSKRQGTDVSLIDEGSYHPGVAKADETFLLRLSKKGVRYSASLGRANAEGEIEWADLGTQTMLGFKPMLALYGRNISSKTYGSGPTHEITARFERLVVRTGKQN